MGLERRERDRRPRHHADRERQLTAPAGACGFLLQATYRMEKGRPVVHLYGRLDHGESFLVRDDRERPHFWIDASAAVRAERLGAHLVDERPARRAIDGREVRLVEVERPQDAPPLRDRLLAAGVDCFEADVRFAYRYLIDRGIRGTLRIAGPERPGRGVDVVFDNPEVLPADGAPDPRVLSLDIETDPQARTLLSVALAGCGTEEVLLWSPHGERPPNARSFRDERDLLRAFVTRVRELDPDVLTGWNVIDFDLAVLERLAARHGVRLSLGRDEQRLRVRREGAGPASGRAVLAGRLVLDGIDLLRGAHVRMESYALDAVARTALGRGKHISGSDRAGEILRRWREDPAALADYNLEDARLVLDILRHFDLIALTVERSRLTGMPLDRVGASVAAFDFLYLSELTRRRLVAPVVGRGDGLEDQAGGHVFEPVTGLHDRVLVFDFKSLYPSVIRTFNIDPLTLVREREGGEDAIEAPNGARFAREPGILPSMLERLVPLRAAARSEGNRVRDHAIKILMNSFYGVLGTSACRFADVRLVNAITGFGRELLLWARGWFEERGYAVLYGDTDSVFVLSGAATDDEARELGPRLATEINATLSAWVSREWNVHSRLELEFERLFLRMLLPATKHGGGGARKRYAGLVDRPDGPELTFTGMEAVRRDWTALARRCQRELFSRLFSGGDVAGYVRDTVARLRAGELDDELVYRKTLRRRLDSYTTRVPPHVAAARKLPGKAPRVMRYVITTAGPEPATLRHAPLDHEHYVQKQVRGVAQPVLELLHLDFDRVIGDDAQGRLF